VFKEVDIEKMKSKFEKADMIYVGGGDTVFMIDSWKQSGLLPLIMDAYQRGVIIAGLSAGAICWFTDMYTDSTAALGEGDKYAMFKGLGLVEGKISPHYNTRMLDFDKIVCYNFDCAYGVEDNAALVIENGEIVGSVSSGGKAWKLTTVNGELQKEEVVEI
jgi:dipeptidase E